MLGAEGQRLDTEEVHVLHRIGSQSRSILDENGVNWDAFLDGYLGDEFENRAMEEDEKDVLLSAEDLIEDEIDLQVALGLFCKKIAELDEFRPRV